MTAHLEDLMTQDGHLTELSLNRYIQGELERDVENAVRLHLETCARCSELYHNVLAFDEELRDSPLFAQIPDFEAAPPSVTAAKPEPPLRTHRLAARRSRWGRKHAFWTAAAALLIAVLAYAVLGEEANELLSPTTRSGEVIDDIRIKGGGLGFQIHLKRASGSVELGAGSAVHPGDRLAFTVSPLDAGFMAIVGVDREHNAYICSPADGVAVWVEEGRKSVQLPGSVEMDALLGKERILALHCPKSFSFDDVKRSVEGVSKQLAREHQLKKLPQVRKGCSQAVIVLDKIRSRE